MSTATHAEPQKKKGPAWCATGSHPPLGYHSTFLKVTDDFFCFTKRQFCCTLHSGKVFRLPAIRLSPVAGALPTPYPGFYGGSGDDPGITLSKIIIPGFPAYSGFGRNGSTTLHTEASLGQSYLRLTSQAIGTFRLYPGETSCSITEHSISP